MTSPAKESGKSRVAIIGSGPAGFYTAAELLKDSNVQVDVFERLFAPYGLVRYGVSPDHQHTKRVTSQFEKTATKSGFRFFGNVDVGRDISLDALLGCYDAVVIASGAEFDRRLQIPGTSLPGCHTSLEFVGWINGHPDFTDASFDLSCDTAAIIGNGNVSLDVARLLLSSIESLSKTDIHPPALEALSKSRISEVLIIGRRGPAQSSFNFPELKEICDLPERRATVNGEALKLNVASKLELADARRRKVFDLFSSLPTSRSDKEALKSLSFLFHHAPGKILGSERVEGILLQRHQLAGPDGRQTAVPVDDFRDVTAGLIIQSIGHRGSPIEGLPFDHGRHVIPTVEGRIVDCDHVLPGLYAVGWIERGATGLIGHNKPDAKSTARSILEDLKKDRPTPVDTIERVFERSALRPVSFEEWKKIDAEEIRRGEEAGKMREKFSSVEEALGAIE